MTIAGPIRSPAADGPRWHDGDVLPILQDRPRYGKPRLWFWENRLKLLLMASLIYTFLISLLTPPLAPLVREILRQWCHRTGKRHRQVTIPLSRLRSALHSLWLSQPPSFSYSTPDSG